MTRTPWCGGSVPQAASSPAVATRPGAQVKAVAGVLAHVAQDVCP